MVNFTAHICFRIIFLMCNPPCDKQTTGMKLYIYLWPSQCAASNLKSEKMYNLLLLILKNNFHVDLHKCRIMQLRICCNISQIKLLSHQDMHIFYLLYSVLELISYNYATGRFVCVQQKAPEYLCQGLVHWSSLMRRLTHKLVAEQM